MRIALPILAFVLSLAADLRADVPYGTVAAVDRIELFPEPLTATRVRIIGAFATREGSGYLPGRRGFIELTCPEGRETACRAHWNTLANAIELNACVAFDWDVAPARVYGPDSVPSATQYWAVVRGVRVITGDDEQCSRARNAPAVYSPTMVIVPPADLAAPPAPKQHWYGYQILAMSLPSQALFWTGYATQSPTLLALGLTSWGLTSPVIHGSHAYLGRAFGGLAIEVFTPLAAGGLSAALAGATGNRDTGDAFALGAMFGGIFGAAADALIATEPDEPSARPTLAVVPTGPAGFALIGRF